MDNLLLHLPLITVGTHGLVVGAVLQNLVRSQGLTGRYFGFGLGDFRYENIYDIKRTQVDAPTCAFLDQEPRTSTNQR
jgi:hypothetical protein